MEQENSNQIDGITFTVLERAVLYARVSRDDKLNATSSLAGQLEMGREYARQKGYSVVAELAEDQRGASGAEIDLPQLNQVREMARNGEFDVLIVREIDRLSRNLAKQLIVEEELRQYNVRVEYVLGDYDDTPEGRLNKHIRATIAEYEREKIRERTTRGLRKKIKNGSVVIANPPFGYRIVRGENHNTLEIVESEAEVVRLIFELYLEGLSIWHIKKRLTEMGIPRPTVCRKFSGGIRMPVTDWNRATVHKILTNETYAGVWYYSRSTQKVYRKPDGTKGYKRIRKPRSEWIAVEVPAIISRDVFEAAQKRLNENKRLAGAPGKRDALLRRRAVCGECGYKMVVEYRGKNRSCVYYSCPARTVVRPCSQKFFRQEVVDSAVWDWIEGILQDEALLEKALQSSAAQREREREPLKRQYEAARQQIEKLSRELENSLEVLKTLRPGGRAYTALLEDVNRIEDAINRLEAQSAKLEAQLGQQLDAGQVERIKEIARQVAQGLERAREDFTLRRAVIEALDVEVRLIRENGEAVAYVTSYIGGDTAPELSITGLPDNCHRFRILLDESRQTV
ncbi:MAG: recombinase family protein [Chloroflexi bacterium]|nr:MAG: recombinase family protein [Chloroflexota bacterium]